MRTFVAIAMLLSATVWADETSRIDGRVLLDGSVLPGCKVTLTAGSASHVTFTDRDGRYSFAEVPRGTHSLRYELPGLITATRDVVAGGERTPVEDVALSLEPPETITFTCALKACSDTEPATPFEEASCSEYILNSTLIESAERGDRSAIALLGSRYENTFTYGERLRIAGTLLGRAPDDRRYWNDLAGLAGEALRFAYEGKEPPPAFVEWCALRGFDPDDYHWLMIRAFEILAADPRGRRLVRDGLQSKDNNIVQSAVLAAAVGLRDESFLPAIEKVLERFPEDAEMIAMWLAWYRSDAADQLAFRFVPEERRDEYAEQQRDCETMNCDP